MPARSRTYRLTQSGRKSFWEAQTRDSSLPTDYRRILGLVEFQGHSEVIRGYLRRYPDALVDEWLDELEEAGLIEGAEERPARALTFDDTLPRGVPPLIEEDRRRFEQDALTAGTELVRAGVYIAAERAQHRAAAEKRAGDTVVLIVEDDQDQLALAEMRVKMAGYAVRTAGSAHALLDALHRHAAPDLLLLDVMLPDGDGFDILARLRAHPTLALLPIVMLTVKNEPADIRRGLELGADGYVTKPYSKTLLADTIRRVLKQ